MTETNGTWQTLLTNNGVCWVQMWLMGRMAQHATLFVPSNLTEPQTDSNGSVNEALLIGGAATLYPLGGMFS